MVTLSLLPSNDKPVPVYIFAELPSGELSGKRLVVPS
jgi:hypothetical protein